MFHFNGLLENLMSFNYRDKKRNGHAVRTHEPGFSVVELMIVCVVIVIIAGIAVPVMVRTYQNYQLDAAGHATSSLLQQARMQAVKTNQPAYANAPLLGTIAFVSSDNSMTYATGEPDIALASTVSFQAPPATAGFHTQLDTYLNGGGTGTAQIAGSTNVAIGFSGRGLPCSETGSNPAVCALPVGASGYIWFMQNSQGWEAVTVTAAGRTKAWRMVSQTATTTTWQ